LLIRERNLIRAPAATEIRYFSDRLLGAALPDPLPWPEIARPLASAEDALARLDERLAKSPIRDGWIARTHFADACAALWLEGQLVHLEDLVLHDAGMDVRAPTHELTRAHAVLGARRRIAEAEPGWALSVAGLAILRGRDARQQGLGRKAGREGDLDFADDEVDEGPDLNEAFGASAGDRDPADASAAVDAAIANAERALAVDVLRPSPPRQDRDPLVYDLDWDEDARLAEWRTIVDQTRALPPALAAALALEAWSAGEPLRRKPWLGQLLAAALIRQRGKTRTHLACLNVGLRLTSRERRRARDATTRLIASLEAIAAIAEAGLKDHERWLTARNLMIRKLNGRRSTSRLPALVDYVMSRPIVSAGMIAKELDITPRAAQNLVAELDLREATGRGRYRAWGVL
jgi:Protein of unknown function (DUF1612)/HTH DNA binding domain